MEEKDRTDVDPNPNGNPQDGAEADRETAAEEGNARRRQLDELTRAYERARDELNEAARSVRAEIAKIDLEQARSRARTWVDDNPTLAVFIGVGAGILTGRLLSSAFRREPPSLSDRALYRASAVQDRAEDYADELAAALAYYLGRAARSAGEAGEFVAHRGGEVAEAVRKRAEDIGKDVSGQAQRAGKDFSRRAEDVGRDVSRRAAHFSTDASRRAEEIADSLADSTDRSVRVLEDAVDDLSKTLRKRTKKARKNVDRGHHLTTTAVNAARTAAAAVVVKKVSDWIRALR